MTPLKTLPQPPQRPALQRRVKRGIVAGYLHGLTQRHGAGIATRPVPQPAVAAAVAQPEA